MNDQEDNFNLSENVFDGNYHKKKIVGLFDTNLLQIFNCAFKPTFCNFVYCVWMLLENSSFKKFWQIHCLGGKSV